MSTQFYPQPQDKDLHGGVLVKTDIDTAEPESSSQYTASTTFILVLGGKRPAFDRCWWVSSIFLLCSQGYAFCQQASKFCVSSALLQLSLFLGGIWLCVGQSGGLQYARQALLLRSPLSRRPVPFLVIFLTKVHYDLHALHFLFSA